MFLKLGTACLGTATARPAPGFVPAHNWDGYNWGTSPLVKDRLYQGTVSAVPARGSAPRFRGHVMATTPARAVVPDYGMGSRDLRHGDFGGNTFRSVDVEKAIEAFAGNSELLDRTIRSHNWVRTDTIFVENEQIEAISNRPPWVAAVLEVGMSDGSRIDEGITYTDNVIAHVMDVTARTGRGTFRDAGGPHQVLTTG